jgi:outer membrane protein assembly factor BamB/pimeloyl-ACP methyl ester carboxylesterase
VNESNKKNHINLEAKATSLTILLISALLLTALIGIQFVEKASAVEYAEYTGTLEGADWALRIPDPWNGMLVLCCRGYSHDPIADVRTVGPFSGMSTTLLEQGFAVAASSYGVGGYCVPEGINATRQLTEYIVDNYNATGKVFMIGASMGGGIALLLGEKYPELYSGVLDMFGSKDMKSQYETKVRWASLNDTELTAELDALTAPSPPTGWLSLEVLRTFCNISATDIETKLGGTPQDEPEAYEATSPVYNANISIPVITVHGTSDALVPYSQSVVYQEAVANASSSSLYRLHAVEGAEHGGPAMKDEALARFNDLVEWSNYLIGAYNWPMFHHDLTHSGYSESPAPVTNQTLWNSTTTTTGGQTSPVIADGKVYVGSWVAGLYCFDAANGTQLWRSTLSSYITGSFAVADGRVYSNTLHCEIYCHDAANGTLLWSHDCNLTGDLMSSSPAVADGKVYVGSYDNNVYCLDALTGALIWNYTTGDHVRSSPAVADGKVYVGSTDNNMYCLNATTGTLIWDYTTGELILSSPAVANDKVYVGSIDNNVYCLDALAGTKIWNYTTGENVTSSPAVFNGKVYVGSYDNNVYCLDAATGAKIWNYTTGAAVFSSPAVADGKVYVSSLDDTLYCLDASTGAFIWRYTTEGHTIFGDIYASPAVANGVVYIYSADRHIYAIGGVYLIPESFGVEVVLLFSAAAVMISFSLFHKRPKWKKQHFKNK